MKLALADRLMQFSAAHSRQMAHEWYKALSTNAKTQAFNSMDREVCIRHAECIYKNLNQLYFAENCEKAVCQLLDTDEFVEDALALKIPFDQIVYAIILLRRHLWLYAEFQALYNGVEDMMQMVENINRVLLVFDYVIYQAAGKYRGIPVPHK
jgi:hypothetical protein